LQAVEEARSLAGVVHKDEAEEWRLALCGTSSLAVGVAGATPAPDSRLLVCFSP